MKLVGTLLAIPSVQKKIKPKMADYMVAPYKKVIAQAQKEQKPNDDPSFQKLKLKREPVPCGDRLLFTHQSVNQMILRVRLE